MDIIQKTQALRAEAWQDVLVSNAYRAFKGLDDAVKAMTSDDAVEGDAKSVVRPSASPKTKMRVKRITQGDIAARVLRRAGEPLPIGRWLEKCVADGIRIKGNDPLANFRSTASRDKRFYPLNRNNMFFWWFTGVALPDGWNKAADPDLVDQSAASNHTSQEGGDGHAANNTNLT